MILTVQSATNFRQVLVQALLEHLVASPPISGQFLHTSQCPQYTFLIRKEILRQMYMYIFPWKIHHLPKATAASCVITSLKLGASSLGSLAQLIAVTSACIAWRPLVVGILTNQTATMLGELDRSSGKKGTSYMRFYLQLRLETNQTTDEQRLGTVPLPNLL